MNRWVTNDHCRLDKWVMVNQVTGQVRLPDCDTGVCPTCGLYRCQRRAVMLTHRLSTASHPRFLTLTLAPLDWQRRRAQVRDLRRRIVAAGYATEWCWTTEVGDLHGMVHVHAVQTGSYIPQRVLAAMWGARRVDIRAAVPRHGEYVSKAARRVAHYISKGGRADLAAALALNGGRLHHWSRGWWGGVGVRDYWRTMNPTAGTRDWVLTYAPAARAAIDRDGLLGERLPPE